MQFADLLPRPRAGAFFFALTALVAGASLAPCGAFAQQAAQKSAVQSVATPELVTSITGYLNAMIADAVKQLGDSAIAKEERDRRVIGFLYKYGDMPKVAHDLTGRYWGRASEAQQQGYMKAFENYVLWSFAEGLEELNGGQTVKIDDILAAGEQFFVRTNVVEASGNMTPVDWKLRRDGESWRVTDVQLEGVSPLKMMQDDFTAVLRASAGNLDALIGVLQKKITLPKPAK